MAAPKRRKSATAAAAAAAAVADTAIKPEETANPEKAPPAPRRSSRRIHDVKKVTEPGAGMRPTPSDLDKEPPAKRRQLSRKMLKSHDGVRHAMRELSEMEHRLQNSTRNQRLAVETSHVVGGNKKRPEDQSWRPVVKTELSNPEERAREVEEQRSGTPDLDVAPIEGPEAEGAIADVEDDKLREEDAPERGAARAPPVNSDYLPLPWTGRLGYPADIKLGQKYVQELGLANARDIVKMLQWNDKYGIKFMRLSSEMFPFASHEEYGYRLAPFAADALAEAGKVAAQLGHRLTTHPGQFTQLGSPRKEVIANAVRDLEYHDELLSLLRLPEQQNKDAIMILHMGGTYGDKPATVDRFRTNYAKLSQSIKNRLVLENDDVSWSVHDLLPICEELNIPMVLDFHHHNIIFDANELREGTEDIRQVFDRIRATWTRKGIRQKMHYSESCPGAVTPRDRRKHSPRVKTLPPCLPDMDLMIEAKDKEQAVFELMRTFKLPGYDLFNDVVPYEREDEYRANKNGAAKKKPRKPKKKKQDDDGDEEMEEGVGEAGPTEAEAKTIPPEEFAMGGPTRRVYWPEGMEEWLKPKKREVKRKSTVVKDES
ncbi:UV-damage endonuclease [Colletotrichum sp. SAR 10_96]|nr:UV-damage endonuclease [Colletotrichum sp. SAR 10_96]